MTATSPSTLPLSAREGGARLRPCLHASRRDDNGRRLVDFVNQYRSFVPASAEDEKLDHVLSSLDHLCLSGRTSRNHYSAVYRLPWRADPASGVPLAMPSTASHVQAARFELQATAILSGHPELNCPPIFYSSDISVTYEQSRKSAETDLASGRGSRRRIRFAVS